MMFQRTGFGFDGHIELVFDFDQLSREAIVADVKLTLAALNAELDGTDRPEIEPWPAPTRLEETDPLSGSVVMNILGDVLPVRWNIVVLKSGNGIR